MLTEKKAKLLISKAFTLKKQIDALTEEYNKVRSTVYDYLDQSKLTTLEADECSELGTKTGTLKASKVDRVTSITYDIPKLKQKLDPELFNEIIDKSYSITDMPALIQMLKKSGVKPKEFKKFISVSEKVNNGKIQQAYSIGDISLNDIAGAYEVKLSKSLQIRKASEKN